MHKTVSDKGNLDVGGIAAEWRGDKYRKPFVFQVRAKRNKTFCDHITYKSKYYKDIMYLRKPKAAKLKQKHW